MRTTIEISDRHRSALLSIAAQRGLRGYSEIIEEALERYLSEQEINAQRKEKILALKGSWSQKEIEQTRSRLRELREKWNVS